jgi:hypothetical protein
LCACTTPATQTGSTTTQTQPQPTIDPNAPLSDGKALKLLAITSSFGLNTTQLLYDIAVAEGCTDVVIGRLYASGCTLEKHVNWANSNHAGYIYTKNNSGKWQTTENVNMQYGLEDEDWDVIFIQQSAAQAGQIDSYQDYIDQLMKYVQANKTNPNARFVWNMTWAYQADSDQKVFIDTFKRDQKYMYDCIVGAVQEKVVPRTDFNAIIPSGTAIQNARTGRLGDTLTRDGHHLNDMGRLIASYTWYAVLDGQPLQTLNVDRIATTQQDKEMVVAAVNAAVANPYTVTDIS